MQALADWRAETIHSLIQQVAADLNMKLGAVAQPLRVAACGTAVSPPIDLTLALLGREKTLSRIQRARHYIARLAA